MNQMHKFKVLLAGVSLIAAVPARAQVVVMHHWADGVEGAVYLDSEYVHTDNFFFQNNNAVSASGYRLQPRMQVSLQGSTTEVVLRGFANYSHYKLPPGFESSYLDAQGEANVGWRAGTRSKFDLAAHYQKSHDPIGTGAQEGQPISSTQADKWTDTLIDGGYRFGAEDAALNFEVDGTRGDRRYTSNTSITQFFDRHYDIAKGVLYFNYSPKTAFLFDVQRIWTRFDEFDVNGVSHDADETLYRVGLQWKASAKTSGDIRAGYSTRDIKAEPNAHSLSTWAGSVAWTPAARTAFSLGASRALQASYLPGASYIDNRQITGGWVQQWGARCSTVFGASLVSANFAGTTRNDNIRKVDLKTEYSLVRYASAIAGVEHATRSSSSTLANFTVNSAYVGVRLIP